MLRHRTRNSLRSLRVKAPSRACVAASRGTVGDAVVGQGLGENHVGSGAHRRMIRRFGTELRALLMLADIVVAVVLALVISRLMFPGLRGEFWQNAMPDTRLGLALLVSVWVVILWLHGGYPPRAPRVNHSDARLILPAGLPLD